MKEATLRKRHRYAGIFLAFFIILQSSAGLTLSVWGWLKKHDHSLHAAAYANGVHHDNNKDVQHTPEEPNDGYVNTTPRWIQAAASIHAGGGLLGIIYRKIVGFGMIWMAISGSLIFFKMQKRMATVYKKEEGLQTQIL